MNHCLALASTAGPANLFPAREQMAVSLGWHIVLSAFGVAFPSMIWIVHRRGLRGDADALVLAKRWSKVATILFAIGAVSGTVLSFEMGLLWPQLMSRYGDVLGLPFALEGIAFFVEAIFLGIYLYGWNRLSSKVHIATLVPVAIAGVVGSWCVVAVNAWMNSPVGFNETAGKVTNIEPWAPLFTRKAILMFAHMWVGAFMVVGFVVAAVYAVGLLKGRDDHYHRLGFLIPFAFASVAAVVQPVIGHLTGSDLVHAQPGKLAAIELATTSQGDAPLTIGGLLIDGRVRFALHIPRVGSLLATDSLHGVVPGLDRIAPSLQPPANAVHLAFQIMVGTGSALAMLSIAFWVYYRRKKTLDSKVLLRLAVLAGPAAVVALEAGWVTTELGRQPWIVYQHMLVADAVTRVGGLWWSFSAIAVLYAMMTVGAIKLLRSLAQRWRDGGTDDAASPYAPSASGHGTVDVEVPQ